MDDCALCAADSRTASTAPHSDGTKMLQQCTPRIKFFHGRLFSDHVSMFGQRCVPCRSQFRASKSTRFHISSAPENAMQRHTAVCVPASRRRGMAGAARPALAFPKPAKACRCVCLRRVHGEAGLAHSQTASLGQRMIFKSANLPSTAQLISRFPPAHRLQTSCRESLRRISRPSTRGCSCALLR